MKNLLQHTYGAFLARFPQPREIQRLAASPIVEGKPVLLLSPTASGKTEAYAAPLIERHYRELRRKEGRLLLLCPTRALVNDLLRRLEGPMRRMNMSIVRRTGDEATALDKPEDVVVVTTPESLDSLLSRHPRWLGNVKGVVLDELHALAPNVRGSQVQILLERLDRVTTALSGGKPQRVAASATVGNVEQLARTYLGPDAVVIQPEDARPRPLEYREYPCRTAEELSAILQEFPHPKALCFVPSRQDAEEYASALKGKPPYRDSVFAHHASLSKSERERVERTFLAAPSGLILATPTLELGIDIGDLDIILLLGAPSNVGSFLQRSGRGGRRKARSLVLGLYRDAAEQARLQQLCELAFAGDYQEDPYHFYTSVVLQQAFSLSFQTPQRRITAGALWERTRDYCHKTLSDVEELLEHAVERGWFQSNGGAYVPSDKLERAFQRAQIHGNFQSESTGKETAVRDAVTGRVLGSVRLDKEQAVPERISLAGRNLSLKRTRTGEISAVGDDGEASGDKVFGGGGTPPTGRNLARHLGESLGFPQKSFVVLDLGDDFRLGHFNGTLWGEALKEAVGSLKSVRNVTANPYVISFNAKQAPTWPEIRKALLGGVKRWGLRLARLAGCGRYVGDLPGSWLSEEVLQLLDVPEENAWNVVPCPVELRSTLEEFAPV